MMGMKKRTTFKNPKFDKEELPKKPEMGREGGGKDYQDERPWAKSKGLNDASETSKDKGIQDDDHWGETKHQSFEKEGHMEAPSEKDDGKENESSWRNEKAVSGEEKVPTKKPGALAAMVFGRTHKDKSAGGEVESDGRERNDDEGEGEGDEVGGDDRPNHAFHAAAESMADHLGMPGHKRSGFHAALHEAIRSVK